MRARQHPRRSHPRNPTPCACGKLWGDEVDDIRAFSVSDWRTSARPPTECGPYRELPFTQAVRVPAPAKPPTACPGAAEMPVPAAPKESRAPASNPWPPILVSG